MKELRIKKESWHYWLADNLGGWKDSHREEVREWFEDAHHPMGGYWYSMTKWVPNDFCMYVRRVLLGVFWALIIMCVVGAVLVLEIKGTYDFYQHFWLGKPEDKSSLWPAPVATIALGLLVLVIWGVKNLIAFINDRFMGGRREAKLALLNLPPDQQPVKADGFVTNAYRTLKDKVCFRVKFLED